MARKQKKGEEPKTETRGPVPVEAPAGEAADAAAQQLADEQAALGRMTPLERAMLAFGLEEQHVFAHGERTLEDGSLRVTIVTQGGRKLRWPGDEAEAAKLTEPEKDGIPRDTPHKNVMAKEKAAREAEAAKK